MKKIIMFETLSDKQIRAVISNNIVGRLGCHANSKTYVVPISYAFKDNCIYARTFEGLKIKMMRENPEVCFQVDEMESMADWKSAIIWGTFEELDEKAEREKGLQILMSRILPKISSETVKLTPEWPFPGDDLGAIKGIVFRINIKEMTGRLEKSETVNNKSCLV
jgi:nitroimidazol reductase NimA-like FMN-containing flavoprotein (pyridoxamine 5'-phosphate oxidase superfamily)